MKIGLNLAVAPQHLHIPLARRAEELGYHALWFGDHIALPIVANDVHPYGRSELVSPKNYTLEPFTQLANLAGVTERIRLATGVIIAPIRNIFLTARQALTVDVVSGGRFDLGLGVGWHAGEFALMGGDYAGRGGYTDDFIRALRELFRADEPEYHGDHINFPPIGFEPKPVNGEVPLIVGGDSPPAVRRAVTLGDGWYGHCESVEQGEQRLADVRRRLADADRPVDGFELMLQIWGQPDLAAIARYEAAGATQLVVSPFTARDPDMVEIIGDYARRIGLPSSG
jgi:probable F420-dependent oxidoreductase